MVRKKPPSSKGNKAKYQIEMSSLSLFFWGFCLCFLVAWVFILGIFVGRGFLPKTTIAELKTQFTKLVPHGKPQGPEAPRVENDPKLEFFDTLSSKKEEVKKKAPAEERKRAEAPARSSAEERKKQETTPRPPAEDKKKQEAPVKAPPEKKDQTPPSGVKLAEKPPGNGGAGQFTVQLAALEDRGKADGLVRSLKEKGFDAYFYEVKVQGKTYYRIRCGRFKTREEAVTHQKKLSEKAKINGIVSKFD